MYKRHVGPPPPEPAIVTVWPWNVAAAVVVLVYVKTVIGICDVLVRRSVLKPADSRKIVHVAAGSWLLFWNLFDDSHWTWTLNILVPAAYAWPAANCRRCLTQPAHSHIGGDRRARAPHLPYLAIVSFVAGAAARAMDTRGVLGVARRPRGTARRHAHRRHVLSAARRLSHRIPPPGAPHANARSQRRGQGQR